MKELNRKEQSLLLYFESRLVNYGGIVDGTRINKEEIDIAKKWKEESFIEFGRLPASKVFTKKNQSRVGPINTHWVKLSEEAWKLAHKYRKERAERAVNEDWVVKIKCD